MTDQTSRTRWPPCGQTSVLTVHRVIRPHTPTHTHMLTQTNVRDYSKFGTLNYVFKVLFTFYHTKWIFEKQQNGQCTLVSVNKLINVFVDG